MKKIILIIAIFVTIFNSFAQNPFPRGLTTPFVELDTITTTQRDSYVIRDNKRRIIYNITDDELQVYNGSTWDALGAGGSTYTPLAQFTTSSKVGSIFGLAPTAGNVIFEFAGTDVTNILFNAEFTTYLDAFESLIGANDLYIKAYNKTKEKTLIGKIIGFSTNTVSTVDYKAASINLGDILAADIDVSDVVEISISVSDANFTWDYDYNDLINKPIQSTVSPLSVAYYGTKLEATGSNDGFFVNSANEKDTGFLAKNTNAEAVSSLRLLNNSTGEGHFSTFGSTYFSGNAGYNFLQGNSLLESNNKLYIGSALNTGGIDFLLGNKSSYSIQPMESDYDKVLRLLPNKEILTPFLTTAIIDGEATGKIPVTREWIEAQGFGSGSGHTIQENGTPLTDRAELNFVTGLIAEDNAGAGSTDVSIDATKVQLWDDLTHQTPTRWIGTQAQYDIDFPAGHGTREVVITDAIAPLLEGTDISSTGVTAGWVLQADGDATSSWVALAGGGDVSKVGTPLNNQIGVWTGDGTLEGDSKFTYDGTFLGLGTSDTSMGFINLYGHSNAAGQSGIRLYNNADQDTTVDNWLITPSISNGDLLIGNSAIVVDDATLGVTIPAQDLADITTLGAKAVITKEYADANFSTGTDLTALLNKVSITINSSTGANLPLGLATGTLAGFTENNLTDAEKTLLGNTSGVNTGDQTASTSTGVAVVLNNPLGSYYNMGTANAGTTYTTSSLSVGGFAKCLINTTTEPTVTGGTKVAGATWVTGTDMYLVIYTDDATNVKFFFLEI